jgi:hypothetical protein
VMALACCRYVLVTPVFCEPCLLHLVASLTTLHARPAVMKQGSLGLQSPV